MTKKETMQFDAEVGKILQLMIHSLYENREIFLRELISNASDACDRLRYQALTKPELLKGDSELKILISVDKEADTLTIRDNGIGMSKADMVKNLGTIARSGTQNFIEKLSGDSKKDVDMIGQFGVGFYSSFMVADKVTVTSKTASGKKAHVWESKGDGTFTIEETDGHEGRGTAITLHLRKEDGEYLDRFRIRHIVETYSNHIAFPIEFLDEKGEAEQLNSGSALWTKNKSDITPEEYTEFFHHVGHVGGEPWMILHNKAEGVIEYTNLLFIPAMKPFDLFHPERKPQIKLYIKRVFIADDGLGLVPPYLRFLRGVVDSQDLPLNISRETLQNNVVVDRIRKAITKKVLGELKKKAEKEPEDYRKFWDNYGAVVKEGLCDGLEPRDEILEVCRFKSMKSGDAVISMQEYVDAMKEDQKSIYFITADSEQAALNSPQLEGFKKRDMDVLLLTDSVDDFWVNVLHEYKDIPLQSVTRAGVDLDAEEDEDADEAEAKAKKKPKLTKVQEAVIAFFKDTLGEDVSDVRMSGKLTDSPVCLVVPEGAMDMRMERFLLENKQLAKGTAKILEINPDHPIIKSIEKGVKDKDSAGRLADVARLLFEQASILEGESIRDVSGFSRRMNALLETALAA